MKVIKKPNIPLQTCKLCGAILKLNPKDMRFYDDGYACITSVKEYRCKVCNSINIIEWENNNEQENRTST